MCVYCYQVVATYCYKVGHSRKEKKNSKVNDVQGFYWLSRHIVYYLCMDKCGYRSQKLIHYKWVEFCHLV